MRELLKKYLGKRVGYSGRDGWCEIYLSNDGEAYISEVGDDFVLLRYHTVGEYHYRKEKIAYAIPLARVVFREVL